MQEIWNEPGGQRLFTNMNPGEAMKVFITQPDCGVTHHLNKNRDLLITEDQGSIRILVETIKSLSMGNCPIGTALVSITPRLAEFLCDRWGYKLRIDKKGFYIRTGSDGCTKAIPTKARMGRI